MADLWRVTRQIRMRITSNRISLVLGGYDRTFMDRLHALRIPWNK